MYTTGKECITVFVYINRDLFPGVEVPDWLGEDAAAEEEAGEEAPPDASEAAAAIKAEN